MAKRKDILQEKFDTVAKRLRQGLKAEHPATAKERSKVSEALRLDWGRKHGTLSKASVAPRQKSPAPKKSKSKTQGEDHGHSH